MTIKMTNFSVKYEQVSHDLRVTSEVVKRLPAPLFFLAFLYSVGTAQGLFSRREAAEHHMH